MATQRAPAREIFGWAMFDFANSAYTTVIVTVAYAPAFADVIVGDRERGNFLWSVALSVSYAIVMLTAPLLGALSDASGRKKQLLALSWIFTVLTTAALGVLRPGDAWLGVLLIALSNLGFAAGESFCAAFLPDLAPPEDLGRVSGMAWGLGYFGGLVATAAVLFGFGPFDSAHAENVAWIGPVTAAFFFFGALPTFALLRERRPVVDVDVASATREGLLRLRATFATLPQWRDLTMFFASLFFAQAGLSIVIAFTFIYGTQVIGWSDGTRTLTFIVTQLTAAFGAVAFGVLQDRVGARVTYACTLGLWVLAVFLIRFTNELAGVVGLPAETLFLGVGALAGSGLGATQSAGRTLVGLFSPPDQAGEMFGFWGMVGKLAAIVGVLGVGALQLWVGLQDAILFCGALFAAALVLSFFVDERRGRARARAAAGPVAQV